MRFAEQLLASVRELPGVQSVAAVSHPPFSYLDRWPFALEGRTAPEQRMSAANRVVSPNYYEVMGIPLRRGRVFTEQDAAGQPGVIIINEMMARRTWGDEDPIGKRLIVYVAGRELPVTVVGVVADSRQMSLEEAVVPEMNFPMAQAANFLRRFNLAGSHPHRADESSSRHTRGGREIRSADSAVQCHHHSGSRGRVPQRATFRLVRARGYLLPSPCFWPSRESTA